jgi:hypothetical protein
MQPGKSSHPPTLDYARTPYVRPWRTRAALALAVPAGLAAGYALSFAGFGFFPVWFFLTLSCPAVLCLIASSRHVLVAVLCPLAMMGYVTFRMLMFPGPYGPMPAGVFVLVGVLTLLAVLFAAGIGMMFAARRRAA